MGGETSECVQRETGAIMKRDSLLVGAVIMLLLLALFSVNSPTLSGNAPPTETPWYMVEFEYMTQEAR